MFTWLATLQACMIQRERGHLPTSMEMLTAARDSRVLISHRCTPWARNIKPTKWGHFFLDVIIRKFVIAYCLKWSFLTVPNSGRILINYAFCMRPLSIFAPDYTSGENAHEGDIDGNCNTCLHI